MKKIIGVMPLWDETKNSLWMLPEYLEGIREAGGLPIIFPLTDDAEELEQLCVKCDGFLLTGGQDVCPDLYGEASLEELTVTCRRRDDMEKIVLKYAMTHDVPLLGICRGLQIINVALGGTLYQDIPSLYSAKVSHRMTAPYDREWHRVKIEGDSGLFSLLQTKEIGVNSRHHQAIRELAPSLCSMAESEDGLIEAICHPEKKFLWAVQWHPEHSFKTDSNSRKIFDAFLGQCGSR